MKKFIKILALCLALCVALSACESANTETKQKEETKVPEKHAIVAEQNAVSDSDRTDSEYFAINDFYNMESSDTRIMIPHFETYQQQLSYGCGPSSAYMVLNFLDKEVAKNYNEEKIAELCGSKSGPGTSAGQIADFFEKEIGWDCIYHMGHTKEFSDYKSFVDNLVKWNLEDGLPIIVDWCVSSGHWTTIIGFDDRGTETNIDDVLIFADSGDYTDHYQDGYMVFSARRFYGMWRESTPFDGVKQYSQQYVVVMPPEK